VGRLAFIRQLDFDQSALGRFRQFEGGLFSLFGDADLEHGRFVGPAASATRNYDCDQRCERGKDS
jgi:hypothetical protein